MHLSQVMLGEKHQAFYSNVLACLNRHQIENTMVWYENPGTVTLIRTEPELIPLEAKLQLLFTI